MLMKLTSAIQKETIGLFSKLFCEKWFRFTFKKINYFLNFFYKACGDPVQQQQSPVCDPSGYNFLQLAAASQLQAGKSQQPWFWVRPKGLVATCDFHNVFTAL